MRLLLFILLSCFVFAAKGYLQKITEGESSFQEDIFQKVTDSSEDFARIIVTPYEYAFEKVKFILIKCFAKITQLHENSIRWSMTIVQKIETQIFEILQEKNVRSNRCVILYGAQVKELKENTFNRLKDCADLHAKELEEYQIPIQNDFEEIGIRVDKFRLAALTCFDSNPILLTSCVFQKMNHYTNSIKEVGNAFNQAITQVTRHSIRMPKGQQNCNKVVEKDVVRRVNEISKEFELCLKN